jgi:multiple sugar transport system substrate-binding protein
MLRTRSLSLLSLLALLLASMTACTSPRQDSQAVTLWMYPIFPDAELSRSFWAEREHEFERLNPDVDLQVELQPWENNNVKLATAFAAGRPPDVVLLRPEQISDYAARGLLRPLEDVYEPVSGEFSTATAASASYHGRPYMIPLYLLAMTMSCNRAVLSEAGFTGPPADWDQVRTLADRLVPKGLLALDYPAGLQVSMNLTFYPFLWQSGGSVFSADGDRATIDSSQGIAALRFLVELYQQGAIARSALTESHDPASGPMGLGRAACSPLTTLAEARQLMEILGEDNVIVAPPLAEERRVGFGYPSGLAVTSRSGNPDGATKFARYMLSQDVLAKLCEQSGFLPTRSSVRCLADDPLAEKFIEQVPHLSPGEPRAAATQVASLVAPHIQAALLGDESPEDALETAAVEIDALLDQRARRHGP